MRLSVQYTLLSEHFATQITQTLLLGLRSLGCSCLMNSTLRKITLARSRKNDGAWVREGGLPREMPTPSHPHRPTPWIWGLCVHAADCSAQYFSRKRRCMAAVQVVGDPGVPLLESIQVPPGLKGAEYPGVVVTSASCCSQPVPSCLHLRGPGQTLQSYIHVLPCAEDRGCQRRL